MFNIGCASGLALALRICFSRAMNLVTAYFSITAALVAQSVVLAGNTNNNANNNASRWRALA